MCGALDLREGVRLAEVRSFRPGRAWRGGGSGENRVGLFLVWKLDVDESG